MSRNRKRVLIVFVLLQTAIASASSVPPRHLKNLQAKDRPKSDVPLIGGNQEEDCNARQDGLGFPVNTANVGLNFLQKTFANEANDLRLLHFSS